MKKTVMLGFLVMICAYAEAATNRLEDISKQIALVKESVGTRFIANFPEPEPYGLIVFNHEFQKLIPMVQASWHEALVNLTNTASDRESRLVLLHALLFLPPEDYLECLNQLLDLCQDGQVSKEEYLCLYMPSPREENGWFLSYNAKDPRVLKLFGRIKKVYEDNEGVQEFVKYYISGRAKFRDRILRFQNRGLRNRTVPLLKKNIASDDQVK